MQKLLSEAPASNLKLSYYVSPQQKRNPDVECLAICLNEMPCTLDSYKAVYGEHAECKPVRFVIVQVGPPGFSSDNYKGPPKPNQPKQVNKNESPLYEIIEEDDGMHTEFYSFKKASNNQHRGERVISCRVGESLMDLRSNQDEENMQAHGHIYPGSVVTAFLRSAETYSDSNPICIVPQDFNGILPEHVHGQVAMKGTYCVLQIGVRNNEQASNGQLLNIKRFKLVNTDVITGNNLSRMPKSMQEFSKIREKVKSDSLLCTRKCIDVDYFLNFVFDPDHSYFTTYEEEEDVYIVRSDSIENGITVSIKSTVLHNAFCSSTSYWNQSGIKTKICGLLDVMMSTNSVKVFVQGLSSQCSDVDNIHVSGISVIIDPSYFMKLNYFTDVNLERIESEVGDEEWVQHDSYLKFMRPNQNIFMWSLPECKIAVTSTKSLPLAFRLTTFPVQIEEAEEASTLNNQNSSFSFMPLEGRYEIDVCFDTNDQDLKQYIKLYYKPCKTTESKRKRTILLDDM